jgi:hypothetical protein
MSLLCAMGMFLLDGAAFGDGSGKSSSSNTFGAKVSKPVSDTRNDSQVQCNDSDYQGALASAKTACTGVCKKSADYWSSKLGDVGKNTSDKDTSLVNGGQASSAISSGPTSQQSAVDQGSAKDAGAGATLQLRADNAQEAKKQYQQCVQDMGSNCQNLAQSDQAAADNIKAACQKGVDKAGQFADQQKSAGMDMGDMSKILGAAAQGLAAAAQLAQAMNQGQGSDSTISTNSNTDSNITPSDLSSTNSVPQTDPIGGSSGSQGLQPNAVAFQNGTASSASATPGSGSGSNGEAASYSPGSGSASGNGAGSGSPLAASSTGSGSGSPGALAASSASPNGKANSDAGAGGAAGAASSDLANPYEMSMGGGLKFGGSGRGGKSDGLDAGADLAAPPTSTDPNASPLDDFVGRSPASTDTTASSEDALTGDQESIFLRIRQKYALLKEAGKI